MSLRGVKRRSNLRLREFSGVAEVAETSDPMLGIFNPNFGKFGYGSLQEPAIFPRGEFVSVFFLKTLKFFLDNFVTIW